MMRVLERWPDHIREHYVRHLTAGTVLVAQMPSDTHEQRERRFLRHFKFYRRVMKHIVRKYPDAFNDPWLNRLLEA